MKAKRELPRLLHVSWERPASGTNALYDAIVKKLL